MGGKRIRMSIPFLGASRAGGKKILDSKRKKNANGGTVSSRKIEEERRSGPWGGTPSASAFREEHHKVAMSRNIGGGVEKNLQSEERPDSTTPAIYKEK